MLHSELIKTVSACAKKKTKNSLFYVPCSHAVTDKPSSLEVRPILDFHLDSCVECTSCVFGLTCFSGSSLVRFAADDSSFQITHSGF